MTDPVPQNDAKNKEIGSVTELQDTIKFGPIYGGTCLYIKRDTFKRVPSVILDSAKHMFNSVDATTSLDQNSLDALGWILEWYESHNPSYLGDVSIKYKRSLDSIDFTKTVISVASEIGAVEPIRAIDQMLSSKFMPHLKDLSELTKTVVEHSPYIVDSVASEHVTKSHIVNSKQQAKDFIHGYQRCWACHVKHNDDDVHWRSISRMMLAADATSYDSIFRIRTYFIQHILTDRDWTPASIFGHVTRSHPMLGVGWTIEQKVESDALKMVDTGLETKHTETVKCPDGIAFISLGAEGRVEVCASLENALFYELPSSRRVLEIAKYGDGLSSEDPDWKTECGMVADVMSKRIMLLRLFKKSKDDDESNAVEFTISKDCLHSIARDVLSNQ